MQIFLLEVFTLELWKRVCTCEMACSLQLNDGVRGITVLTISCAGSFALFASPIRAEGLQDSPRKFVYKDASGRVTSVRVIHQYRKKPIVHPFAKIDPRL